MPISGFFIIHLATLFVTPFFFSQQLFEPTSDKAVMEGAAYRITNWCICQA